MRSSVAASFLTLLALASAAPLQTRGEIGQSIEETIGSVTGTGSGNEAGNGNDAGASGNGNGNTGAAASAGNFLNGASATGNGVGNGNDGNSAISLRKKRGESSVWGANPETSTDEIIGSIVGDGSENAAGIGNAASAWDNGNGNTGATAGASNFLNGASATDNGVGNGNDGNAGVKARKRGESSSLDEIIGSVVGTGSSNSAGDGNNANAGDNGNSNTGASAGANDFLNWASATDNGVGNGNSGNSGISARKRGESPSLDEIIGSVVDTGSWNAAGNDNNAAAGDNGNGNTGASAGASNFLNGASATGNGVGNGNDDNSAISLRKRIAELESALSQMQKRQTCESNAIGSVVSTGASNLAGSADAASAINNGNSNTGSSASASNFLNGASANDNGAFNDNDDNTLINVDPTINL